MEIRIKISDAEFAEIESRSKAAGFPTVTAYGRSLLFPEQNYELKWAEVKAYISKLEPDEVFQIRDALPNPPSLFGKWAYDQRAELGIEPAGKDRQNTNKWRKIKD
ncbi:hypothetical protein [Paenibacillus sp. FSL W7-1287]|uniref:hypothetical protein n=1 Tax=Paenibacillus sp. FSL W7-1287 TaxID=2954538 RepID=UPI0030FACC1F